MPAKKGNRYWIDNENFFKPKKYTPGEIQVKFFKYLEESEKRFIQKAEAIKSGDKAGTTMDVGLRVPLTIGGFCSFLGITLDTFINYEKKDGYEAYFDVIKRIRQFIETEQIEGTTVGIYNSNIIARLQGLRDKTDMTSDGEKLQSTVVEFQLPSNGRMNEDFLDEKNGVPPVDDVD